MPKTINCINYADDMTIYVDGFWYSSMDYGYNDFELGIEIAKIIGTDVEIKRYYIDDTSLLPEHWPLKFSDLKIKGIIGDE